MFRRKTAKGKTDPEPVHQNSSPPPDSDESFLENIYREILGREIDGVGKEHYLNYLKEGNTQISVILDILKTEEFINKIIKENVHLLSITEEKSDAYGKGTDRRVNKSIYVFHVKEEEDFDWLEEKILTNGYYEMPGVWSLLINEDKRLMAEITSLFEPGKVLDIGCANGPIMKCLRDLGKE